MRECWYFACNQCKMPLRAIVDNPSSHVKCSNCGGNAFHEITKAEYDCVKSMKGGK